jgi:predicted transcriptional regulator
MMRILEELRREPRGPTRLAQAVNLSYDKCVPLLLRLERNGQIIADGEERQTYSTTPAGNETFNHWEKVWESVRL